MPRLGLERVQAPGQGACSMPPPTPGSSSAGATSPTASPGARSRRSVSTFFGVKGMTALKGRKGVPPPPAGGVTDDAARVRPRPSRGGRRGGGGRQGAGGGRPSSHQAHHLPRSEGGSPLPGVRDSAVRRAWTLEKEVVEKTQRDAQRAELLRTRGRRADWPARQQRRPAPRVGRRSPEYPNPFRSRSPVFVILHTVPGRGGSDRHCERC